jgi:hypothetical protein
LVELQHVPEVTSHAMGSQSGGTCRERFVVHLVHELQCLPQPAYIDLNKVLAGFAFHLMIKIRERPALFRE